MACITVDISSSSVRRPRHFSNLRRYTGKRHAHKPTQLYLNKDAAEAPTAARKPKIPYQNALERASTEQSAPAHRNAQKRGRALPRHKGILAERSHMDSEHKYRITPRDTLLQSAVGDCQGGATVQRALSSLYREALKELPPSPALQSLPMPRVAPMTCPVVFHVKLITKNSDTF